MEGTLATAFDGGRNAIFAALLLLVLLHLHCYKVSPKLANGYHLSQWS